MSAQRSRLGLGIFVCLFVLGGNIASVSSRLGFVHKPRQVKELDHYYYIEMAKGPQGRPELAKESTYAWRVLVPALARGLNAVGLSLNTAFYVVTNVCLFGFLLLFWVYLGDLGFSIACRVAGLGLVGLTQAAVRWYEYQYWMTDPLCLLLMMAAFVLIRRGQHGALHAPSIVAAFVRENYAVVYPYYFLHLLKTGTPWIRAALRTAALCALPLAILIGLRMVIETNEPDDILGGIAETLAFRWRHMGNNQPYVLTLGSFGVLLPLLLLVPRRFVAWLRRDYDEVAVVAFFYGVLLIANNTERELAYALPAVVPAALRNLQAWASEVRLPEAPVLAAAVALQGLFFSQQRFMEIGMSMYQPTNLVVVGAMAAFWLLAQALSARRGRPGVGAR